MSNINPYLKYTDKYGNELCEGFAVFYENDNGDNLYRSYCVKCNNIIELKSMLSYGVAGLPYVVDWAIPNLEKQEKYPVYVGVRFNTKLGIILSEITEKKPLSENICILTYNEFKQDKTYDRE